MRHQNTKHTGSSQPARYRWPGALMLALATGAAATLPRPAQAIGFDIGDLTVNLDTTLSYGVQMRVAERDPDLIGKAHFDPLISTRSNAEQRAAKGRFSNNSDDGNLKYDQWDLTSNAFRITTEMDAQYENFGAFVRANWFYDFENEDRDDISDIAKRFVGEDFTLLDAYIYGDFELPNGFMSIRIGRQVVSWGENTFIQNGINVINPVDVARLRQAGSQLKEAFLPINMIWTSVPITQNLSLEGVLMTEFEQIDPDPAGTYFGTNDFATPGGQFAMLGFGLFPDDIRPDGSFPDGHLPRAPTRFPDDDPDQFGFALRYFAPDLGFTEFGLYYLHYHSRLPLISGTSVTTQETSSGNFFVTYPEDIDLVGLSFNTTLGGTWSLAGEVSHKFDAPYQIDDVEVLFAGLSPLNALIPQPVDRFNSQLGNFGPGEEIQGFERFDTTQIQATLTNVFPPSRTFGWDQLTGLLEVGATQVWDLPPRSVLRFNGPGTDTGGGPDFLTGNFRNPITQETGFATEFSAGYRLLLRASYENAIGSVSLEPTIAFNHDIDGVTPGPGGNFVDGRKTFTASIGWNYLDRWSGEFSYTNFFGAGNFNLIHDRDFLSGVIRFSF